MDIDKIRRLVFNDVLDQYPLQAQAVLTTPVGAEGRSVLDIQISAILEIAAPLIREEIAKEIASQRRTDLKDAWDPGLRQAELIARHGLS